MFWPGRWERDANRSEFSRLLLLLLLLLLPLLDILLVLWLLLLLLFVATFDYNAVVLATTAADTALASIDYVVVAAAAADVTVAASIDVVTAAVNDFVLAAFIIIVVAAAAPVAFHCSRMFIAIYFHSYLFSFQTFLQDPGWGLLQLRLAALWPRRQGLRREGAGHLATVSSPQGGGGELPTGGRQ